MCHSSMSSLRRNPCNRALMCMCVCVYHLGPCVCISICTCYQVAKTFGARRASRPIRLGTDCSGWDSIALALTGLGVDFHHVFASDTNKAAEKTVKLNHRPDIWFPDVRGRQIGLMPKVDIYHCGFPCQSFSSAGRRLGQQDERGLIVEDVMKYIEEHAPPLVLLENVKGLLQFPEVMRWIMKKLRHAGYYAEYKIINACDHGLPQHRERVFIVGTRRDVNRAPLTWPAKLPPTPLASILDPMTAEEEQKDLDTTYPSHPTLRKKVKKAYRRFRQEGIKPSQTPLVMDIDSTKVHPMFNMSPCLTRSRSASGGHWLTQRGRRLTVRERERLMGLHIKPWWGGRAVKLKRPRGVTDHAWGAMIGNAIAVPCLQRVLAPLMHTCFGVSVSDPWVKPRGALI